MEHKFGQNLCFNVIQIYHCITWWTSTEFGAIPLWPHIWLFIGWLRVSTSNSRCHNFSFLGQNLHYPPPPSTTHSFFYTSVNLARKPNGGSCLFKYSNYISEYVLKFLYGCMYFSKTLLVCLIFWRLLYHHIKNFYSQNSNFEGTFESKTEYINGMFRNLVC